MCCCAESSTGWRMIRPPAAGSQKLMIWGKLYNGRWSIERTKRDHKLRIDAERFENASAAIRDILPQVMEAGFTRFSAWSGGRGCVGLL